MKKALAIILLAVFMLTLSGCSCKHESTVLNNVSDATCDTDGYTGDIFCLECGELVARGEVVKAEGHTLSDPLNAYPASCYGAGYTGDVYCTFCGELIAMGESIAKLEHVPGETMYAEEPTCEYSGYTGDVVCELCGDTVEYGDYIEPLPHTPGEPQYAEEPTCQYGGYTGDIYCEICGDWMESGEYIDPLPHTPGEPENAVEATCSHDGYTGDSTCTVCGSYTYGEVIPKSEHEYVDGVCAGCGWMDAGLYIDGEMAFTWEELVANSYVTVDDDNELTAVAKSLYGTMVVEEGVTVYNSSLFKECLLNAVYLPSSVDRITYAMFCDSVDLEEVRCFGLPEYIDAYAFEGCISLKEFVVPEGATSIESWAFNGCTALESIELPDTLMYLDDGVFKDCTKLESIELPSGLTYIGYSAFENCESITELALPESVTYIGDNFLKGSGVTELTLPANLNSIGYQQYSTLEKLDMSATTITELYYEGFAYSATLEEVILPAGLVEMDETSFRDCTALKRLALPDGFNYIYDGWSDMTGMTALTEIVWPASLTDGSVFAALPALDTIYFRGSELQWDLTASKDLFRGKTIVFDYDGE